jgi:hypothetical protein
MRVNRALLATPPVRRLLLVHWLPPAFAVGAESLLVVYAQTRGLPPGSGGLLLACLPVGMIIGNLVAGRLLTPSPRHVAPLILLLGLPFTAFPLNPHPAILAVLAVVSGTGFAYTLGIQQAFLDAVPSLARGQAFGLLSTGLQTPARRRPGMLRCSCRDRATVDRDRRRRRGHCPHRSHSTSTPWNPHHGQHSHSGEHHTADKHTQSAQCGR